MLAMQCGRGMSALRGLALLLLLLLLQPSLQAPSSDVATAGTAASSYVGSGGEGALQEQPGVEEFYIFDPMQLHDEALNIFQRIRKDEPNATMDYNSTFMKMARDVAVKHLAMPAEEDLKIYTALSGSIDATEGVAEMVSLKLPMPSDSTQAGRLFQGTNEQMMEQREQASLQAPPELARASAVAFVEDVGTGAISKSGALPIGAEGAWLKLAEDKLHSDAQLNFHELLWEVGSDVVEKEAAKSGKGLFNATGEEELLASMTAWFTKGGGVLRFVEPRVVADASSSSSSWLRLVATEEVSPGEAVVSVPMNLVMCRQTARNVVVKRKGKYLGEELAKTFDKDELHGMMIFLLHEYFKEVNGKGSKWGPYIRTLRMRFMSSQVVAAIEGTRAGQMYHRAMKACDEFLWWAVGAGGPCAPNNGICRTNPEDKAHGDGRFAHEHMRWAYWVVKQNAVKVRHAVTGVEFIALVPFYNMAVKEIGSGGGVAYERDGSVCIRAGRSSLDGAGPLIVVHPGNLSDPEFFLRHLAVPPLNKPNPHNYLRLAMPGALAKGSKFHFCLKGSEREKASDACMGAYKGDLLFWKSKVLGEWRQQMNLPPRLQDIRLWAHRLHLYGVGDEEALLNANNRLVAGLPLSVDDMPAEEQLMLMGLASTQQEAALMVGAPSSAPQLYSAPDPEDDPMALRAMRELAYIAARTQNVVHSGNTALNATAAVINRTRDFFIHGVLPKGGLDELDEFLMKKIGLIGHCGFDRDMRIVPGNVTQELLCAMRVHLMDEPEVEVFCPQQVKFWEDACSNVAFGNFTAVSLRNELSVVAALRRSIGGLLGAYPTSAQQDRQLLGGLGGGALGAAVLMRLREKELLNSALTFLNEHEQAALNGSVPFQLEERVRERAAENERVLEHKKFVDMVQAESALPAAPVSSLQVDISGQPPATLSVAAGRSIREVVGTFCRDHDLSMSHADILEKELRARAVSPPPLLLLLGVVITRTGERSVLAIPQGRNFTVEVAVFCARHNVTTTSECDALSARVERRLAPTTFTRSVLVTVPVDAPDGRKLQLTVYEGEQHDLRQLVADFFEHHSMAAEFVDGMTAEVAKRLPKIALEIPIQLPGRRGVVMKFAARDNVTSVVNAFEVHYEINEQVRVEILSRARAGLAPGSYVV